MTDSGDNPPAPSTPRTPRTAARWIGGTLLCGIVLGAVFFVIEFGDGVSEFVRYDRLDETLVVNGELCRGWRYVPRGSTDREEAVHIRIFSPSTGYLVLESEMLPDDVIRTTVWSTEGKVIQQTEFIMFGASKSQVEEPWWWGAEDQTEPSAPEELLDR